MLIRRDRKGPSRFTIWRVALLFLGAGIWLGGVMAQNRLATGVAIVVLLVALLMGFAGRNRNG